jgi:hypothetical protein
VHGALNETDHFLMTNDWQLKVAGFSSAFPMRNMNDTKNDLEGMGLSVITAAVGPQNGFEPQVVSQNPR